MTLIDILLATLLFLLKGIALLVLLGLLKDTKNQKMRSLAWK